MLRRLWRPRETRRPSTPVELFGRADRFRRDGRHGDAARLVDAGLRLDPNNVTGHLLAAYLHVAARTTEPARREFRWVLQRDPNHPRALVGLARISLEEGDVGGSRALLTRALQVFPDFPEAQALLDGLRAYRPATAAPAPASSARLERLRLPGHARALVIMGVDGAVVVAQPDGAAANGPLLARTLGIAAATLQRAGFGAVRRAIIQDTGEAQFLRGDSTLVVALALPRTTHVTQGQLEVNRLWAAARHELSITGAEAAPAPAPASRRVS